MPEIVGSLKPPRLSTAPSAPALGQIYFDIPSNTLKNWNGTAWVTAAPGTPGAQGPQGPAGSTGATGPQGPAGPTDPRLGVASQYITTDWNLVKQNGWYHGLNVTNAPGSGWFQLEVVSYDNSAYVTQEAWRFDYGAPQPRYRRSCANNTWSAWFQIEPIDDSNLPSRLLSMTYNKPSMIADANTAKESGWYSLNGGTNAPPGASYPNYSNIYVASSDSSGSGNVTQLCFPFWTDETWFRRCHSGTWQPWKRIFPASVDDTGLPARLQSVHSYSGNLDNEYQNGWTAFTVTTTNRPADCYGYCHVLNLGSGNVLQLAYQYNDEGAWMRRKIDGGAWGAWKATYVAAGVGPKMPARLERDTTTYGVSVADWNNARENGWYQGAPGAGNAPDGQWYVGEVVAHRAAIGGGSGYITQRIWRMTDATGIEYRRWCIADNWTAWARSDVGAAGALSTDTGWQNWIHPNANTGNFGAPWGPPQFRRLASGQVIMRGMVQFNTDLADPAIGYLPAGYYPLSVNYLGIAQMSQYPNNCRVDVEASNGVVTARGGTFNAGTWVSMNNVTYMTV